MDNLTHTIGDVVIALLVAAFHIGVWALVSGWLCVAVAVLFLLTALIGRPNARRNAAIGVALVVVGVGMMRLNPKVAYDPPVARFGDAGRYFH